MMPRICRYCGWLTGLLLATSSLPAEGPPLLRRVDVPADRPDLWPSQSAAMVAVPRDEFERLWAGAQPRDTTPPAATLESARYEAAVTGSTLGPGRCTWNVRRHASRPVWLSLGRGNIAIENLAWSDRPAIWGADATGVLWLWVDASAGELTGTWSATGQIIADEIRFALEFPAALASTLTLTTPLRRQLLCEDAPLRSTSVNEDTQTWDLALGSRAGCRLRLAGVADEPPAKLLTYRRQQVALIREDHLKFQTTIKLEVLDGAVDKVTFSVPTAVEILSIAWGNESSLTWTREKSTGPRSLVTVNLPDRLSGELPPIVLDGDVSRRPGSPTGISIPDVEVKDGVFISGDVLVTVSRPLEVVAVRTTGCRQQAPVSSNGEGESYSFRQSRPESLLTFEVRSPRSTLTANVLSVVTMADDQWTQQSDVAWRSTSGTAFQLALRLPAGWEVIDIDAFSDSDTVERITWERLPEPDGATKLAVELLEALRPEAPRRLTIWSRRRPIEEGNAFENPAVRPLECQSVETVLAFQTGSRYWLTASDSGSLKPLDEARLSASWTTLPLWSALTTNADSVDAWFHSDRSEDAGLLLLESRPLPVTADVAVEAEIVRGVLTEEFRLRIRGEEPRATERLLLFLTQPGTDVAWQVEQPEGVELLSRRLTGDQRSAHDLPAGGELWELRLPQLPTDEVVILGTRVQPMSLPARVGLAIVPQATVTTARVSLVAAESLGLQPAAHRLESLPQVAPSGATNSTVRRWEWRYSDPTSELSLVSRRQSLAEASGLAQLELRSLIAASQEAYDYHQADCTIPALERPIRLHLPSDAELLVMTLDGSQQANPDSATITIPPRSGDREQRLQLVYRTPHRSGFLVDRSTIAVPAGDELVWAGLRWEFFIPPGARLADEPIGVRLEQPLPRQNWWTRLFGPLGRTASQSLFVPWSLTSWRNLAASPPPTSAPIAAADASKLMPPADWQGFVAYAQSATDIQLITWHAARLRLLAWLGVLMTFTFAVLLRLIGWGLRDRVAGVWLAVLGGLALTWEGPSSELIGGVIAGTVIALLVPRRWLGMKWSPVPPRVPMGSTQSFRLPPGAVTTGVGVLVLVFAVTSAPVAEDATWQPETTVLVPVDADGQPSRSVPLVYLHPRTLEQLRGAVLPAADPPAWLLQSAGYDVSATAGQRWPMAATLKVLVCDAQPVVTIPLRLAGASLAGPQSCLVDGVPAAVTVQPQSGDLQVTWTRSEPAVSAIGHDQPSLHTISLRLQIPWKRTANNIRLAAPFPIAPCSRWTLSGLPTPGTMGDAPGSKRSPLVQVAGPIPLMEVPWVDPTMPPTATTNPDIDVTEVWEVNAMLVEARTRSIIRPRGGPLSRLVVDLPAGAAVSRVHIQPEARLQRLASDSASRPAIIEFAEPLYEPATVELDYVVPHPIASGEFSGRGLLFRTARTLAFLPQSRRWAIATPSDLRVEPQALESSGLAPVSRASVENSLAGLLGERSPQSVYQVQGEAPIPFKWTATASRRQLLLWQQTGTLERDRLKWELEGDLEVSGAPVYSHVLSIDRRLRVESISVRERGADRLVRWSETRFTSSPGTNRITLFLSDPCVETQRITLTASAAVTPNAPLPLPNIRCEDAELRGGRLLFTAPAGTDIAWSSTRGLRNLNPDTADATEPMSGTTWIYDQTEADWRATIRVHPAARFTTPQMLQLVQADGDDQIRLTLRCRFPWSRSVARWEWRVPSPWTPVGQPVADNAAVTTEQQPDGHWSAVALPVDGSPVGVVTWQFAARRDAFRQGSLLLPRWVSDMGRDAEIWLADATPPPVAPLLADTTKGTQIAPADWAARWMNDLMPMRTVPPRWQRLAATTDSVAVQPSGPPQAVVIAWLEHNLWRMTDGSSQAVSIIRPTVPCPVLAVRFLPGCRFRAARADGREAIATTTGDGVRIAAADGSEFCELQLYWDQQSEPVVSPLVSSQLVWPEFPGCTIGQQAVSLYPAPVEALRPGGGWQAGDWMDRALLRLETLSDHFGEAIDPATEQYLKREFLNGYSLLADKFGRQPDILEQGGSQRAARWQAIVATTNRIGELPLRDSSQSATVTIAERLADHPAVRQGMVPPTSTGEPAWRIDREWARWLLRCVCVLLLLLVLKFVVRREWSEWLKVHPHAATAVLGLVWWLCLTPSIVGFALIVLAAVRAASAERPTVELAS